MTSIQTPHPLSSNIYVSKTFDKVYGTDCIYKRTGGSWVMIPGIPDDQKTNGIMQFVHKHCESVGDMYVYTTIVPEPSIFSGAFWKDLATAAFQGCIQMPVGEPISTTPKPTKPEQRHTTGFQTVAEAYSGRDNLETR